MDCQHVDKHQIIERYLTEQLSGPDSAAFEEHYLGCRRCFEELQLRHAVALELKAQPEVPLKAFPAWWRLGWSWGLAAAAVLLLGVFSIIVFHRRQDLEVSQTPVVQVDERQEIMARLAAVDSAPVYVPWTIRGGKTSLALERFQQGMQRYMEHDYAGALGLLREAARLEPAHLPTHFYLGISYLLADQPGEAIAELSRLTGLKSSPYKEESHWYLAKAFLRKSDLGSAQKELETVVALKGPHGPEAGEALEQLREVK